MRMWIIRHLIRWLFKHYPISIIDYLIGRPWSSKPMAQLYSNYLFIKTGWPHKVIITVTPQTYLDATIKKIEKEMASTGRGA